MSVAFGRSLTASQLFPRDEVQNYPQWAEDFLPQASVAVGHWILIGNRLSFIGDSGSVGSSSIHPISYRLVEGFPRLY